MKVDPADAEAVATRLSSAARDPKLEFELNFVPYSPGEDAFRRVVSSLSASWQRVASPTSLDVFVDPSSSSSSTGGGEHDAPAAKGTRLTVVAPSPQTLEAVRAGRVPLSELQPAWLSAVRKRDAEAGRHPLPDLAAVVNLRTEEPMDAAAALAVLGAASVHTHRLKQRVSFRPAGSAFRIDCTVVTQTSWPPLQHAAAPATARYEVEIELVDGEAASRDVPGAVRELFRLATLVYANLEATRFPMSKPRQAATLREYLALCTRLRLLPLLAGGLPSDEALARRPRSFFVGPGPVSMDWTALTEEGSPSIVREPREYAVTVKADGERGLLFVPESGVAVTINSRLEVRDTGRRLQPWHTEDSAATATAQQPQQEHPLLLDGEVIQGPGPRLFLAFDAYVLRGTSMVGLPLLLRKGDQQPPWAGDPNESSRLLSRVRGATLAEKALARATSLSDAAMRVRAKAHLPLDVPGVVSRLLDESRTLVEYGSDGLVFTPSALPVGGSHGLTGTWDRVLKWKPPEMNTIDFLVRSGGAGAGAEAASARWRLMVGCKRGTVGGGGGGVADPTRTAPPLDVIGLLAERSDALEWVSRAVAAEDGGGDGADEQYEFATMVLPRPCRCQLDGSPVKEGLVVECSFVGGAWRPLRARPDKTRLFRMMGGIRGAANDVSVARNIWSSICNPVTEAMVRGDAPVPIELYSAKEEAGGYYARDHDVRRDRLASFPMMDFHTRHVKGGCLIRALAGRRALLDVGCGKAGDLGRWLEHGFRVVVGVDSDEDNLLNPEDGAYARLAKRRFRTPRELEDRRILFLQWDLREPLEPRYDTPLVRDRALLLVGRTALAHFEKTKAPKGLAGLFSIANVERFDAATAMFCLHYFFCDRRSATNVLQTVASRLVQGGLFVACFLDAHLVDALLSRSKERAARGVTPDGRLMWELVARYEALSEDPAENFGKTIDVFIESINRVVPEPLLDHRLLVSLCAEVGLRPHDAGRFMSARSLPATGTFEQLFRQLDPGDPMARNMTEQHKTLSFMHRWVVFVKR
jgi:SAM-dependent methyltransferase